MGTDLYILFITVIVQTPIIYQICTRISYDKNKICANIFLIFSFSSAKTLCNKTNDKIKATNGIHRADKSSYREPSAGERRQMFLQDITHELHAERYRNDNRRRRRPLPVTGAAVK
ncbi:MAG: hypothetical protein PUI69_01695 [bacterium]|nr:hypothetical protein [bacterium]